MLDFTIAWAGPLAGRWLADLGAEVIHVEHRLGRGVGTTAAGGFAAAQEEIGEWRWGELPGPTFRSGIYPDADPGERPWNRQGLYNKMQRNKLCLCMDLKAPGAREILLDLVRISDIVLDNYSPRGIRSMGLDYETLVTHKPDLIRVAMSGYGYTGPDQMRPSWGPILEGHSGMTWASGYEDGGPLKVGVALPDPTAGLHAVVAIFAALDERDRTGQGCFIDLSQLEIYASLGGEKYLSASATGVEPPRLANRSADRAPQGVYPCQGEDEWLAISVETDDEWVALAGVLGATMQDDLELRTFAGRVARHDEIDAAITAWSRTQDRFDAMHRLQAVGVRASPLMTNGDIVENEHLASRGFIVEWEQVDVGPRQFAGFPIHFEDPAEIPMRGAPGLGQDNERVLVEILGYAPERVRDLLATDIFATSPE
ncbi:MAG: CoA transferase [Acidimicrobiaceae bacterium]|nr:CoA transferase [Acidimicrobiaceae bacterium]